MVFTVLTEQLCSSDLIAGPEGILRWREFSSHSLLCSPIAFPAEIRMILRMAALGAAAKQEVWEESSLLLAWQQLLLLGESSESPRKGYLTLLTGPVLKKNCPHR